MVINGRKLFELMDVDAIFVLCEYQMQYVAGFAAENGGVVVDKNGVVLYTDSRYIEAA